jgi:hypothetical protein
LLLLRVDRRILSCSSDLGFSLHQPTPTLPLKLKLSLGHGILTLNNQH